MQDPYFAEMVRRVLAVCPIAEVARAVGASQPCVRRWAEGMGTPHPAVVPSILRAFDRMIADHAQDPVKG